LQTTGVWLPGALQREYRIAPNRMQWITAEDAHVPGFVDPESVRRAAAGATLTEPMASGETDAAIRREGTSFGETRSIIPEPGQAAAEWPRRTGGVAVNHAMAARADLAAERAWLAGGMQRLSGTAMPT
jgi:4,5-dihydroxyphthalate decarboxylase